jgi:hypothetical protein
MTDMSQRSRMLWLSLVAYEVNTDRGYIGLGIGVIGKPEQQARLAHPGVSDQEELEEVIVSGDSQTT